MARPRSEDKQQSLLRAATQTFASLGLGAPTAKIAKQAGVAEGTLFRYFPTKDALLGAVFEHLVEEMETAITRGDDSTAPLKIRTQSLWERYIDWGIEHPDAYATINQLAVSGKLTSEQLDVATKLCSDISCQSQRIIFPGLSVIQSAEFADALMTAIANATVGFAAAKPEFAAAYKSAGFDMVWKTLNQKD